MQQEKHGQDVRNDRVIAVQKDSRQYASVEKLTDLEEGLLKEIIHFFASYNNITEDKFIPLGNDGASEAIRLIEASIREENNVS